MTSFNQFITLLYNGNYILHLLHLPIRRRIDASYIFSLFMTNFIVRVKRRCYFIIISVSMQQQRKQNRIIYFRRKNQATYSFTMKKQVNLRSFAVLLSRKQSIAEGNLLMFHKGREIDLNFDLNSLNHRDIIHVVDLAEVKKDKISVDLKFIGNHSTHQVSQTICSQLKIKDFVQEFVSKLTHTPYFYIGLVYLGKILNPLKSFQEQLVQDASKLIVVNVLEYANSHSYKEQNHQQPGMILGSGQPPPPKETNKPKKYDFEQQSMLIIDNQDEPFEQTRLISELPNFTLNKFTIRVSQVESDHSDDQNQNMVKYSREEKQSIISEQPEHINQPNEKKVEDKYEKIGVKDLEPGDMMFMGPSHENQTESLLDIMLNKYKVLQ